MNDSPSAPIVRGTQQSWRFPPGHGPPGIIVGVRDDDQRFAEIVNQEFDATWDPSKTPHSSEQTQGTHDDFHLNLYDDDETYRDVSEVGRLSPATGISLGLVGLGLLISLGRFAHLLHSTLMGWCGVGFLTAGVGLFLYHQVTGRSPSNDDEGVV